MVVLFVMHHQLCFSSKTRHNSLLIVVHTYRGVARSSSAFLVWDGDLPANPMSGASSSSASNAGPDGDESNRQLHGTQQAAKIASSSTNRAVVGGMMRRLMLSTKWGRLLII